MEHEVLVEEISEEQDSRFLARVKGTSRQPVKVIVTPPFTQPEHEELLSWYCEVSDSEPLAEASRLHYGEVRLERYGLELFRMVFGSPETALPNNQQTTIRIVGGASFCALHWELMRDPERGPVALDSLRFIVREARKTSAHRQHIATRPPYSQPSRDMTGRMPIPPRINPHPIRKYPTLNIIFVTARHRKDRADIPLRVESLAILELVRKHKRPMRFDLVRPGSLQALVAKLESHDVGFYHVLHFDCHGVHGMSQNEHSSSGLLLETEHGASLECTTASQIARIVDKYKIPIVFTSACRSSFGASSFAHDLLSQSSVQFVVAMAFSVLFDSTARFAAEFYLALLPNSGSTSIREAAQRARCFMAQNKWRLGSLDRPIEREDWWIPVVYDRSSTQPNELSRFELCSWDGMILDTRASLQSQKDRLMYERRARKLTEEYRNPANFLGRDDDLLQVEWKVLSQVRTDNILLLLGMIGIGKTTFLDYVSWWWHVTGLVLDSFVFRMNVRTFTVAEMVRSIQAKVWPSHNTNKSDDLRKAVTKLLRENRYLVVIDGVELLRSGIHNEHCSCCESDSGSKDAANDGCEEQYCSRNQELFEMQCNLAKWLGELHGGQTVVLIGSRGREPELFEYVNGQSVGLDLTTSCTGFPTCELRKLDDRSSIALGSKVLGIENDRANAFYELLRDRSILELLGGNPFLIKVLVGSIHLVQGSALPSADTLIPVLKEMCNSSTKTVDVFASIKYSFNRLSHSQQRALLFLAPFTETVTQIGLKKYATQLISSGVAEFDRSTWDSTIEMAAKWGLLTSHERLTGGHYRAWRLHACLSAFLTRKHRKLSQQCNSTSTVNSSVSQYDETKSKLRYIYRAYVNWASELYEKSQSRDKGTRSQGQLLIEVEYGNIERALSYALSEKLPFYSLLLPMYIIRDNASRRVLCEDVINRIGAYSCMEDIPLDFDDFFRFDIPRAYHLYGMALASNQNLDMADEYLKCARTMWKRLGWRNEQVATIIELGWVASGRGDYGNAEKYFTEALSFSNELDRARAKHNLGQLAVLKDKLKEAEAYFKAALTTYRSANYMQSVASSLHHLAIVSTRLGNLEQAEAYARESLSLRENHEDEYATANCLHLLGNILHRQAVKTDSISMKLSCLQGARGLYNKAFLKYDKSNISRERDMLYENFGLLLGTCGSCMDHGCDSRESTRQSEMHFYELVKRGPFPKSSYNLGQCLEELGEVDAAYKEYCAAADTQIDFAKDTQDHEAQHMALRAQARCMATGVGVKKDTRKAVEMILRTKGIRAKDDVFDERLVTRTVEIEWDEWESRESNWTKKC